MNLFNKTNQLLQRVLFAVLCLSFGVVQAQTTSSTNFNGAAGHIVATRVANNGANGSAVRIIEYNTSTGAETGAFYEFASTGVTDLLVQSYNATSEGYIDRSEDGNFVAVAGYNGTTATTGVVAATSASVNRKVARVGGATNGTAFIVAQNASATAFSGQSIRSGTVLGGNFYGAGNGTSTTGGVHKFNPAVAQVYSTIPNVRVAKNFNNRLFFSTASTSTGVHIIGTYDLATNTYTGSAPTSSSTSTRLFALATGTGTANSSLYDFSISPDGTVVYTTDDNNAANGGIYKYVWASGAWSFVTKFDLSGTNGTRGCWGMYVDWTNASAPVIYANRTASADNNALVKFTDAGSLGTGIVNVSAGAAATTSGFTVLASAGTGFRFKGVTKSPTRQDVIASKLVIQNVNAGASVTRFRSFTITVQGEDANGVPGILSSTEATPITLAVPTGTGVLNTTTVNFPPNAVSANFTLILDQAGEHTISVADGRTTPTLTGDVSSPFTVLGAATSLVFSGLPTSTSVNSQFGFTVTATRDDLSAETTYPGSCVVTSTGAMGAVNYTANFVNGVATFTGVEFTANGTFTFTANAAGTPALSATSSDIIIAGGPQTYTWVGADNDLWSAPASWSPERTTIATSDRILFNGGTAVVRLDVNTQSIATLKVINGADVKLIASSATDKVLSIGAGVAGNDFEVEAGSSLTLSSNIASTGIKLNLVSGNYGVIGGSVLMTSELTAATNIDNQITAVQAFVANTSGIDVLGTAVVEQSLRQSGNAFGNTTVNSIKFRNNAQFRQSGSASNPFGTAAPNSVIDFEPNARFVIGGTTIGALSLNNRTYPVIEVDADYTISGTFTTNLTVNRIRINAGKKLFFSSANSVNNPLVCDSLELGENAEYRETVVNATRVMSVNRVNAAAGSKLQFSGAALNLNFVPGSSLKSLTNLSTNAITVTTPVVVDSVVAPVGGNIVSNGNITLNATSTSSAYVAGHTGITGQVVGNVTVNRFIRPTYFNGTAVRHLSHPFTTLVAGALANPINANQIQVWNENSNASVAGSGWTNISDINTVIAAGQGFAFNVAANSIVSVTGALNNGNVVREITRNASGWNLVGNPYAQTIDWDAVTTDPAFDNTKIFAGRYHWVSASSNTGGWIGYVNGFPAAYRSIAPMTAFLVRVKTGNPTVNLTFKNAHRTVTQTTALSRTATDTRPAIELTLDRGANTVGDITSIYFQNGATGFFNDAMDAQRMGNNSGMPTLYSVVNNTNYAVKGLPNLTNELVIPLGIRFHTAGTHRLSVANLQNMAGYNVYLIDYNSGTSELLTATSAISISGAANTTIDNYALHFVPLNVTSVGAKVNAETVAVYPNPSVDGKFNVALTNVTADGVATVTVINTLGQVVAKQTANVTAGANQIAVSTSGLKTGTYSIQVRTASSIVTSNVVVR